MLDPCPFRVARQISGVWLDRPTRGAPEVIDVKVAGLKLNHTVFWNPMARKRAVFEQLRGGE